MGSTHYPASAPGTVVTPAATYYAFFVGDGTAGTTLGTLYKKDSSATVTPVVPTTPANNSITNAMLAQAAAYTVKGNNTGATANEADLTVAQLNAIGVGVTNGWIDVTTVVANPVNTSNSAATNNTNLATILAAAPAGSTIYFPGGTYNFASAWTMPASKQFTFQGQGFNITGGNTILNWSSNVGADLIVLASATWYYQFRDLTFTASVTQTAGAVVNVNGNVATNFTNCTFGSLGGFFNNVLYGAAGGSGQSWNSATITNCMIAGYKGVGVYCDSAAASLVISNSIIQGDWGGASGAATALQALAGVQALNSGAIQIGDCDILGSQNNILLNPGAGAVNASFFCTDTYFDSSGGSCIKITGAGATVRARFDTCSFTTAGTNFSTPSTNLTAVEISSTFAYGAGGQGIDFVNCNVLNTFGTTGTTNGFLISGTADFSIGNCRIAGWTNGVQVTPIATAGRTQCQINNNTIGPAGGYGGNSVGILLNAGAATYGDMVIESNILVNNTSAPMTDNSTVAVGAFKKINGNPGYMPGSGSLTLNNSAGAAVISGRGAVTSSTTLTALFGAKIPANAVPVGQVFRVTANLQASAAATIVVDIHAGAAGTTADTVVATLTGTSVLNGYSQFDGLVEVAALGASNTVAAQSVITNGTAVINKTAAAEALSSVPTTAAWFITVSASASTGTLTVKGAAIEAL